MKAVWKNKTVAESTKTQLVDGYHYFPPEAVKFNCLQASDHKTTSWIGEATYYHVVIGSDVNNNAAWTYANPAPAAAKIKDHIAFARSVQIS
jgi:uncharacterized protein (DUF427 family)